MSIEWKNGFRPYCQRAGRTKYKIPVSVLRRVSEAFWHSKYIVIAGDISRSWTYIAMLLLLLCLPSDNVLLKKKLRNRNGRTLQNKGAAVSYAKSKPMWRAWRLPQPTIVIAKKHELQLCWLDLRAHLNEKLFLRYSANLFFVWFDLHLIGRKVNQPSAIWCDRIKTKKNEFDKSFGTSLALRAIQIGEFVQLDVACSWNWSKPRKLEPCRRLLHRWDPSFPRDRAAGTAAVRGPTAPSTD